MERPAEIPEPTLREIARSLRDPGFLGALCHDLRGPVGALGTWIHVLASGKADATTQRQALTAMQKDVAAQSSLIEQIADLSSMLAGTLRLYVEEVDVTSMLREFGGEAPPDASPRPRALADPKRLRQMLAILLPAADPAHARGPSQAPVAESDEPRTVSIRGLAGKGAPSLVGLTLARALAEIQGGRLTITEAGAGTSFTIHLPTP